MVKMTVTVGGVMLRRRRKNKEKGSREGCLPLGGSDYLA
jgi:hypothetical protein